MGRTTNWVDRHDWAASAIAAIVLCAIPIAFFGALNIWDNINFNEGYEIVIQGRVETHTLSYDVGYWWKYPYTKIVLRTLSESTYTLELYGHHEFDVNSVYRITYTRISPLGHHAILLGKVISIELIS